MNKVVCACVIKWNYVLPCAFVVKLGVRQGSVLSPFYMCCILGRHLGQLAINAKLLYVIIYADDILLISSSICELQRIFDIGERELMWLDMVINVKNLAVCVLAQETIIQPVN